MDFQFHQGSNWLKTERCNLLVYNWPILPITKSICQYVIPDILSFCVHFPCVQNSVHLLSIHLVHVICIKSLRWVSNTLDPRLESHQCLYARMWIKMARPPYWLPRGKRVLHWRWIWVIHYKCQSMQMGESTLPLKPRADVNRSPKQGYQWPHKKDLCPPKFFANDTCHSGYRSISPKGHQKWQSKWHFIFNILEDITQ